MARLSEADEPLVASESARVRPLEAIVRRPFLFVGSFLIEKNAIANS